MFNLFKHFRYSDTDKSSQLNTKDICEGMVLVHRHTGQKWVVAHNLFGIVLINEDGQLTCPSPSKLKDYCNQGHKLRTEFEIELMWKKANEVHRSDKRLLTRLGFRLSPEVIRQYLLA